MIIRQNGNVGIGISAPANTLQVGGLVSWGSASSRYGILDYATGKAMLYGTSGNALSLGANGTGDYLYITTAGLVGIGTVSPTQIMHIYGTSIRPQIESTANGGYSSLRFVGKNSAGTARVFEVGLNITADDVWQITDGSSTFVNVNTSGNVGIGTAAPSTKLEVVGTALIGNLANTISTPSVRFSGVGIYHPDTNYYGDYAGLLLNASSAWTGSAKRFLITNALNANKFAIIRSVDSSTDPALGTAGAVSSGTADFVIDASGNIGIGTTSPSHKLTVTGGNLAVENGNMYLASGYPLYFDYGITNDYSIAKSGTVLQLNTAGSFAMMGGNVGIGTTSPSTNLEIYGSSPILKVTQNPGVAGGGTIALTAAGVGSDTNAATLNLYNGSLWSRTDGSGIRFGSADKTSTWGILGSNVGVGTTNPTERLDVVGNAKISSTLLLEGQYVDFYNTNPTFRVVTGPGTFLIGDDDNVSLSSGRFFVKNNGNIGIGTTSPQNKLQIANGGIYLTSDNFDTDGIHQPLAWNPSSSNLQQSIIGSVNSDYADTSSTGGTLGIRIGANGGLYEGVPGYMNAGMQALIYGNGGDGAKGGGYLQFLTKDNTTSYSANGDVRMTINPIGNVGIGTTTPVSLLGLTHGKITVGQGANDKAELQGGTGFGALLRLYEGSGGTETVRLDAGGGGGTSWITSGNVGIGTTSPDNKLSVVAGGAAGGFSQGLSIITGNNSYTTGHGGMLQFQNEDVVTAGIRGVREDSWKSGLSFYTHSSGVGNTFDSTFLERMRIDGNGNVGIGTTGALTKLDVNGVIGKRHTVAGTVASPSVEGALQFVTGDTSTLLDVGMFFVNEFFNNNAAYMAFKTRDADTTIRTAMTIYKNGNVGIGTTSPSQKLQVAGNIALDAELTERFIRIAGSYGGAIRFRGNASAVDDRSLQFGTMDGNNLFTPRMIVDTNSGNVGIGTVTPAKTLEVNGDIMASSSGKIGFRYSGADNNFYSYIEGYPAGGALTLAGGLWTSSATQKAITFKTQGVADAMSILNNGNVGIGTTSPQTKLSVSNGGSQNIEIDPGFIQSFNRTTPGYAALPFYGSNFSFNVGNVGIGTTNPTYPLEIKSAVGAGALALVGRDADNVSSFEFLNSGKTSSAYIQGNGSWIRSRADGGFHFSKGSTPIVTGTDFTIEGLNVGIGTTSPNAKLDVAGIIRSNASNVGTLNLGSDSFSSTYTTAQIIGSTSPSYTSTGKLSFKVLTWGVNTDYGLTEQMYIDVPGADSKAATIVMAPYGGNVGIGTTSPQYSLHSPGSASFGLGSELLLNNSSFESDTSSPPSSWSNLGNTTGTAVVDGSAPSGNNVAEVVATGSGTIGYNAFKTASPLVLGKTYKITYYAKSISGGTTISLGIQATVDYQYNQAISTSWSQYSVTHTGTINPMTIGFSSASGAATFRVDNISVKEVNNLYVGTNGSVGIGSTSPISVLEVKSAAPILTINGTDNSQFKGINFATLGSVQASLLSNIATGELKLQSGTSGFGGFMTFNLDGSERMRIQATTGNVGIGTTAPGAKFETSSVSSGLVWNGILRNDYNANATNYGVGLKLKVSSDGVPNEINKWVGLAAVAGSTYSNRTDLALYTSASSATDPTEKMRIDGNGNVGIGTQTPGAKLDVIGNIYLSSANPYGGSSVYNVQKEQNVSSASVAGAGWYRVAQLGDVRGQNTVTIYTTGGSYAPQSTTIRWWHDWSAQGGLNVISEFGSSFWSQARVTSDGITNSYLEVYFNQAMAGGVYLSMQYDGGFAKGSLYSGSLPVGGDTVRMTTTTGLLSVGDKLTINNSGNVGIGITSPSQKLDVNGILKIEGQASSTFNSTSQGISFFAGNDNYKIGFDSQAGSRGYIRYNVDTNDSVHGHIFSAGASGSQTDLMTILGNGNVGIGTANPGTKLDIQGAINTSPVSIAQSGAANNTFGDYIGLDFKMSNEMSQYTGNPAARISAYLEGGSNGYGLDFWTKLDAANFSKAMRINRYGNVGIGTTSPGEKLHIYQASGEPHLALESGDSNAGIYIKAAAAAFPYIRFYQGGVGKFEMGKVASNGNFYFNNTTASGETNATMVISSGGNVGIGTTSPDYKLTVNSSGNTSSAASALHGQYYGPMISTGQTSSSYYALNITNNASSPGTGNSIFYVRADGNIGIGTTNPRASLEIAGGIRVADGVYGVSNSAGNQILASSSGSNYLYSRTSGNLIIRNGADSAELLRITDSGNVGIGTTSPNQKLEVSGTIRQSGCTTAGTISVNASGDIICTPSSISFKNTREDLEVGLQTLIQLKPVSYKFNDNMDMGEKTHFGFISEEVDYVLPELATHDKDGKPYGLDTNAILAVTVNAVKELNTKVEEMNLKISDLSSLDTTKATSLGSLIKTFLADEYNRVEKIFAKTVVTEGLEMKDSATGETYCVMVTNGEINKVKGKCGEPIVAPASQAASPVVSTLPTPSCTDGIMNQDETGIDTGGICDVPVLADMTAYDNALAAKVEADYTTDSWALYKAVLDANIVTNTNTQVEVDTAVANITSAQGSLIPN